MKTTYSNNQRVTAVPLRMLCTILCCALLSLASVWTQQDNMVVLTTTDGERQISTAEVQSIRFEGGRVVLTQPWGQIVYNRTLSELTFFRPLPGMLRLSVSSTINKDQVTNRVSDSNDNPGTHRALGLDGEGRVKSTWDTDDRVYVYTDALTTTSIGTLIPTTTGSATATLLGDIEKAGLTNGQTLYLSTVPRPHSFAEQTGTLESLFYATAESALTISGGNAYMNDVTFNNSQSITKFTMKDGYGDDIAVKSLTITGGASPITVTPASASAEVFVAMPQTSVSTEYSFTAVDTDNRTRTGTKKANVQEGKYYTADVTVKLAAVVNTAPVANTLNYNGTAQTLVTAAVATGGTLSYKLGTGTYSESIPAATDIGNYTVYYKVTGDADHHDVAEASVPVSIGRGLGSISFGTTSEVNKTIYTDGSYSDVVVTKVGDGPVSYTSSNQAVAQVGASSGEVTIFGVGQTTITATATSGTCYDYAEPTAQYTLTVHKAVANIGYATQTVNKTYADVNFTNSLSNSGNGTVAYSVPDANGVATVNASSGEVTIIGVGTTTVTATATDAATYTYATKVATYTLNVAPRIPTVSLSATNGSCYEGSSVSFTASVPAVNGKAYDGTLSVASSNSDVAVATIDNGTVTVTAIDGGTANITVTAPATTNWAQGTATYQITVNNKITGSISYATNTENKTYGDDTFTKTLTKTGDGSVSYASGNTSVATVNSSSGLVTIVGAGTAVITATVTDGVTYTYPTNTASYTLTVGKATLSATTANQSRTYGEANPSFTVSVTGFVKGETAGTAAGYTAPTASCVAGNSSNVGTYDITVSGGSAANYAFAYTKGTLTVSKATLTATADNKSRAYGVANPTFTVSVTGFKNNETAGTAAGYTAPTASSAATSTSNVGTYDITVSGGLATNYAFTYAKGTLTVGKATPTYTAPTAKSLTYNGSAQALVNGGSTSHGTIQYATSQNGTYSTTVPTGTAAGSYTVWYKLVGDGNHTDVAATQVSSVSIGKKSLSISAQAKSKTYGAADPTLTYTSDGLVGSDGITGVLTRVSGENVGTYAITQGTLSAGNNYAISYTGSNLTINKATLTATADNKSRTYGASNPSFTVSVTGFKNNETAGTAAGYSAPTASCSATSSSNAGTYDITVSGGSATNYAFTYAKGTLTINKAAPTYTAPKANSLTYNGSAQALVNAGSTLHGTIQYATSQTGTYSTTVPTGTAAGSYTVWYKLVGDGNHTDVAATQVSSVSISPKTVSSPTITLGTTSYTYDGNAKTPSVSSVVDGSTTIPSSEYTVGYSNNTNAGTATVTITDKSGGNYTVSGTKTFTINKAAPTYTAPTAKSLTYNGSAQALVNAGSTSHGTIQFATSQTGTYSTTVPTGTAAGSYTVWYKLVGDGNHTDVAATQVSSVSISKAAGSISYGTTSVPKTFGDAAFTNTLTKSGDGSVTYASSNTSVATVNSSSGQVTIANAGSATITATVADGSNYTYATKTATYTVSVSKAAAYSVTAAPTAKTSLTYNGSGQALVNAGTVSGGTLYYQMTTSNSKPSSTSGFSSTIPSATNAGTYYVWYYAKGDGNHNDGAISTSAVSVSISPKTVSSPTITLSSSSYTYDGGVKTPTVTVKDGSTTISTSEYIVSYNNNVNAGTATVTVTDNAGGNYTVSGSTSFTINKAAAYSVTAAPTAKTSLTYNGSGQALVNAGTVSGGTLYYQMTTSNSKPSSTSGFSSSIPSATNAGTYYVWYYAKGDGNHNDGAISTSAVAVSISPKTVSSPTITLATSSYTYDGSAKTPAVSSVADGSTTISSGEYTVSYSNNTNAGTATVTITDKSGGNYTVSGTKTFTINKAAGSISYGTTSVPKTYVDAAFTNTLTKSGDGSVTYSSSNTSVATVNSSSGQVTIAGAGSATITATVTDGSNYTYATKTATYTVSVSRANPTLSLSTTELSLTKASPTGTVTVTRSGDGVITATSSNTSVATVSVSGTTVTVTAINAGSATITIQMNQGTNYNAYTATDKTVSVTGSNFFREVSSITSSDLGNLICSNGHVHPRGGNVDCDGVAVAMIAYVGNGEADNNYNRGLAMALKSDGTMSWYPWIYDASYSNVTNIDEAIADVSGISHTNIVGARSGTACYAAKNHMSAVPNCSQWFLPAIGQWIKVLGPNGVGKFSGTFQISYVCENSSGVISSINNYLTATGVEVETFNMEWSTSWTSSERADFSKFRVSLNQNRLGLEGANYGDEISVRAFLAF